MAKKHTPPLTGGLRYVGDGSGLDNIPARDLSHEEVQALIDRIDELLRSGLYQPENAPAPPAESEAE
jgi:hypothetical protein